MVTLPLRWEAPAPPECRVDVVFDGRVADQARPDSHAWMPMRFRLPPAASRTDVRELELRVSDARCRLMVGPLGDCGLIRVGPVRAPDVQEPFRRQVCCSSRTPES